MSNARDFIGDHKPNEINKSHFDIFVGLCWESVGKFSELLSFPTMEPTPENDNLAKFLVHLNCLHKEGVITEAQKGDLKDRALAGRMVWKLSSFEAVTAFR